MADITHNDSVVTESKLKDFYEDIKPFLGCPAYLTSEGNAEYYSTEEKVIGRWTDGKPLYQKVIYFSPQITITANSWQNIKSDETDIECIVDAIILRNDGVFIPQYGSISPSIGTRGLWVYTTQLQNTIQGIILKYTKTTDSASTTIQSDPNEYSTEERIVGKWIDGKPLYQRTFSFRVTVNGWANVDSSGNHSTWKMSMLDSIFIPTTDGSFIGGGPSYGVLVNIPSSICSSTNFRVYCPSFAKNNVDSYITVKYTKTTD